MPKSKIISSISKELKRRRPEGEQKAEQDIREIQRNQFVQLANDLRIMMQKPSSYDSERERMALSIGEFINLSYQMIADKEEIISRMKKEMKKAIEVNEKFKTIVSSIAEKDMDVDMTLFVEWSKDGKNSSTVSCI